MCVASIVAITFEWTRTCDRTKVNLEVNEKRRSENTIKIKVSSLQYFWSNRGSMIIREGYACIDPAKWSMDITTATCYILRLIHFINKMRIIQFLCASVEFGCGTLGLEGTWGRSGNWRTYVFITSVRGCCVDQIRDSGCWRHEGNSLADHSGGIWWTTIPYILLGKKQILLIMKNDKKKWTRGPQQRKATVKTRKLHLMHLTSDPPNILILGGSVKPLHSKTVSELSSIIDL